MKLDDLTQAEEYALADLDDGFEVLEDEIEDYAAMKTTAFTQQHALVTSYFTRGLTDEKNMLDILDEMNVHYIQGVGEDPAVADTYIDNGADLSVYDDCFDHFQYDVGHLKEYSPAYKQASRSYSVP